ncbi:hypothetical protein OIV83_002443 [Microbotryomycetes sp. JL201]|nr:hypothetical protein OIV83_002443 [Microbotryomycetes sp. JL201]
MQTPSHSEERQRRPSTAEVRELALHGVERAKRVQSLQYASVTVFQTSITMVLGSLAFAVLYGWSTSVPTITIELDRRVRWAAVECSAFLIVWIYTFFYLPLSTKLLYDSWVNLPRRNDHLEQYPPDDTLYSAEGRLRRTAAGEKPMTVVSSS